MMLIAPTHGVRAIERRPGPSKDLNAIDAIERHGNVGVVVSGLAVVQPDAVNEDDDLAESTTTHGEVGLRAEVPAAAHLDAPGEAQHIGDGPGRQTADFLARENRHRPRQRVERDGLGRRGHDHRLCDPRTLGGRILEKENQKKLRQDIDLTFDRQRLAPTLQEKGRRREEELSPSPLLLLSSLRA